MMVDADGSGDPKDAARRRCRSSEAFDVFTHGFADWWPVATHSIGGGAVAGDWRIGGLVTETVDGQLREWADVLEYDPPHGLLLRWRVTPGHRRPSSGFGSPPRATAPASN